MRDQAAADDVLAVGVLFLVVVALWLPFGLKVGPTFEEWKALYWTVEQGRVPVLFPNRPLHYLPLTLAHFSGQPLLALNLMQAGAMLGKGVLIYSLVARLIPAGGALGLLAGVLAIIYPADTGLFTLRTLQIHLAVFLDLVAIHLMLSLWERRRWWHFPAMWTAQALSLSLHISSIPFQLASPALLVWRQRAVSRRLLAVWAACAIVPASSLVLNTVFTFRGGTYEAGLWAASGLDPSPFTAIIQILGRARAASMRHVTGWLEPFTLLQPTWGDVGLALATAGAVVAPALWWQARRGPAPRSWTEARPYLELAAIGFVAMPLGFLLFLPSRWGASTWRTLFHSSLAAAVVVAMLAGLLAARTGQLRRAVLAALGGILVVVALISALTQHRQYAEIGGGQQRLLAAIMHEAPGLRPGTAFILVDLPPYRGVRHWSVCGLVTECFQMSMRYVYASMEIDALFCAPGHPPRRRSESCQFERDGAVVEHPHPWAPSRVVRRYPYDRLVVFETTSTGARLVVDLAPYREDGATSSYRPEARIDRTASPPARARAMLPQLGP